MKLKGLHTALQQTPPPGELSRLETPFANSTALEMLTKIAGLPLGAFDLPPPMFVLGDIGDTLEAAIKEFVGGMSAAE